jgi:hypothetical protein
MPGNTSGRNCSVVYPTRTMSDAGSSAPEHCEIGAEEIARGFDNQYQDVDTLWAAGDVALVPVLPLEIAKDGACISLFTVIATFGTPQDVTADELRIESLFPADEATERLFRGLALI